MKTKFFNSNLMTLDFPHNIRIRLAQLKKNLTQNYQGFIVSDLIYIFKQTLLICSKETELQLRRPIKGKIQCARAKSYFRKSYNSALD